LKGTSGRLGLLPVLNVLVLVVAYAGLFSAAHVSNSYRVAMLAGAGLVAAVAMVTFVRPVRACVEALAIGPATRILLSVTPWFALVGMVGARALWWTQRAAPLRFFILYGLANWSVALALSSAPRQHARFSGPGRAAVVLAAGLGVLGLDGAAFGVNPFGCRLSAALAAAAACTFAIACRGSRAATLKLLTLSFATVVTVATVEGAVRVLNIGHNVQEVDSREYAREFYTLTPPRAAFVNEPNTLDEFGPALIAINSNGIRGPELTDGRADVLLIGDSMIEARQLPWEQTLGPNLQRALRARGVELRVVAHGMRGWSPLLEWNWYLKVGRTLHARTVMLFFFWNDLWTEGDEAATFSARLRPDGRPDYFDVPVDSNWIWYKHVRVIRLAEDVLHRLSVDALRRSFAAMTARTTTRGTLDHEAAQAMARKLNKPPLTSEELDALLSNAQDTLNPELRQLSRTSLWPGLRALNLWTDTQRTAAAKTEVELQRFAEDVASDGGRLVIVYVPNPLQVSGTECSVGRFFERVDTNVVLPPASGIQTWLHEVAERNRIELLDPSDAMRAYERRRAAGDDAPLYLRADCHWSARGHEFMANYIAEWFQNRPAAELPPATAMLK
jgi:hypothetical protein